MDTVLQPAGAGRRLKIVIESNIPYLQGVLEPYAEVLYRESEEITPAVVRDADALLVRTRTKCNADLLAGSSVSFVGTATIGLDHIDQKWCADNGIETTNAPGCNAPAVAQYVLATLAHLANRPISQYKIGIVGVGHVGRIVEQWARGLNMDVMLCDAPRQRAEGGDQWHTLDELAAACDVITMHTPLTRTGQDATYHLADSAFFGKLQRAPIFINAARGPVVDTAALIEAIDGHRVHMAVVDTWEGEPVISRRLLERAIIATPHIAGYSLEGKMRASRMVLDKLTAHFGLPRLPLALQAAGHTRTNGTEPLTEPHGYPAEVSLSELLRSYDPHTDDALLRSDPAAFEHLRNHYALRPEPRPSRND